jgi:hypothetical protein
VPSPALDDDLGLPQSVEDLAIEKLVPHLPCSRSFHSLIGAICSLFRRVGNWDVSI